MRGEGPNDAHLRIAALFTRSEGEFRFARWGRPLAPVVYGTDDDGVRIFESAIARVAGLAGLDVQDVDPELGANVMVFFCRAWPELKDVPHLGKLIPDLEKLVNMLGAAGANQYRIFGFDEAGAIRICLVLIRYDEALQTVPAQTLALGQALMAALLWSDTAFMGESPLIVDGTDGAPARIKPWYADLVRAAYDPALPATADDESFALRLAARMAVIAGARAS